MKHETPGFDPETYRHKWQKLAELERLIDRDAPLYFALTDGHLIVAALEAVAAQLLDELSELDAQRPLSDREGQA